MKTLALLLALALPVAATHATTRTSANYTNDGSAGSVVGVATVASPAETAKNGYIGQLTELSTFSVTAAPATIAQATTSQLTGTATLDDGTTTVLGGRDIAGVQSLTRSNRLVTLACSLR